MTDVAISNADFHVDPDSQRAYIIFLPLEN
ncbi:hypothetical protein COLO4_26306 [Corchorus olitorius]|uniref:Uncharacterized protein n=1 Tax=Corchorus olitorius TaxID=93759 RepID=A0A1R3HXQ4_9ROSI|nr:hypothetical protein COLO4_26306 [Corchorus olitorius]